VTDRGRRLDAIERKLVGSKRRGSVDEELRRLRRLTVAELVAELRALATELEEPLSARDLEYIEALERGKARGGDPPAAVRPTP
jgi:hypothetical protein